MAEKFAAIRAEKRGENHCEFDPLMVYSFRVITMKQFPLTKTLCEHQTNGVLYYTFPSFDAIDFIRHGFSTRLGGVSEGIWHSMNLSFTRGDDETAVRENFKRFCGAIGTDYHRAVVSAQEHHIVIRNVTAEDAGSGVIFDRPYTDVDGLITDVPGLTLVTQYADCVPLFFVDPVRRVVATAHAGWKGTVAQIGAVTVSQMCRDYGCKAKDVLAAIGPSIGPCCFEVDAPVYEQFSELTVFDRACFNRRGEKFDINMWEVNRRILIDAGILPEHITVTDLCTKCHPDIFWSHRIFGKDRGSLAGFIAICDK